MEVSVWSSYFRELTPEKMVEAFTQKGFTAGELSDEHGETLMERGQAHATGKQFRAFAQEHGMHFPQGHLWLRCDICTTDRQPMTDRLKKWLDLFDGVGIRSAVLHPGGEELVAQGCDPQRLLHIRADVLRELAAYIQGSGMTICLENIPRTTPGCEDLLTIIEAVGADNLGICLDTGHLNMRGKDQAEFIKKAGAYLKALHIADNEGISDQHLMPYGRGTVKWEEMLEALKESGYRGLFNFEIPGENRAPMEIRMIKLDYIKKVADYMLAAKS